MKTYKRPVALVNNELAEGVYMASGASSGGDGNCYTVTAYIHQTPETGRPDYRIQVDAKHNSDKHHSGEQTLKISFNQPVEYISCNANGASLKGGNNTSVLEIGLRYHNNANDNIGFGDLVVKSEAGLAITGAEMIYCNRDCGQHY